MNKSFWVIMIGIIGLMVGLFVLAGGKDDSVTNAKFEGDPREVQASDYTQGNADSGVVLMEYGDFECPACLGFFPLINQLKEEKGDQFQFVFRHFPLTSLHPNALAAHRAAEAANKQGKFWEMHDLLYETQTQWGAQPSGSDIGQATEFFNDLAGRLELDVEQFKTDFASDEALDAINRHIDSGGTFDATATPTLVLNGEKISTPATYEQLEALIDEEIAKVTGATEEN